MAPHSLACITSNTWDRPYSREYAAFPTVRLQTPFSILVCKKKTDQFLNTSICRFSLSWDPRPSSGLQFHGSTTYTETNISSAPAHPWTSTSLRMKRGHRRDLIKKHDPNEPFPSVPFQSSVLWLLFLSSWFCIYFLMQTMHIAGLVSLIVTLLNRSKSDSDLPVWGFLLLFLYFYSLYENVWACIVCRRNLLALLSMLTLIL